MPAQIIAIDVITEEVVRTGVIPPLQ